MAFVLILVRAILNADRFPVCVPEEQIADVLVFAGNIPVVCGANFGFKFVFPVPLVILRGESSDVLLGRFEGAGDAPVQFLEILVERDELFHVRVGPTEIHVQHLLAVTQEFGVDFCFEKFLFKPAFGAFLFSSFRHSRACGRYRSRGRNFGECPTAARVKES